MKGKIVDMKPYFSNIEYTERALADQGHSFNEAGQTFNQAGVQFEGKYGGDGMKPKSLSIDKYL
jgi:hypothetical protein